MQVQDELARLPGVSDVTMLGQRDYSMRIWVDPDKLAAHEHDGRRRGPALREQNCPGRHRPDRPAARPEGQAFQVTLSTLGRLIEPEQFEKSSSRRLADGRIIRLKDVARLELGAKNQDIELARSTGSPRPAWRSSSSPTRTPSTPPTSSRRRWRSCRTEFPEGVDYEIRYDTTPFIRESIDEVFKTLQEAIILVAIVVLVFLQNWRSAIIPLIAVPVAIIGTFAIMAPFGFSLNNLTLFGLVLAIGIVVDDAIVVVEAVEHHIEHGLAPRDATIKAMDEVSGPVIAIGLVLTAVFVPCAFISGIVGQFFRQFALTIASVDVHLGVQLADAQPGAGGAAAEAARREGPTDVAADAGVSRSLGGVARLVRRLVPWRRSWPASGPARPRGRGIWRRGPRWPEWSAWRLGCARGAGWSAWPLNLAAGRLLPAVQRWVPARHARLHAGVVGMPPARQRAGPPGLRRAALPDLRRVHADADGVHPLAGHGLSAGQRPVARLGLAERTQAVMDKIEQDRDPMRLTGIKHTQTIAGQSLLLNAFGSNFGSMFVILDVVRQAPRPGTVWRGDPRPRPVGEGQGTVAQWRGDPGGQGRHESAQIRSSRRRRSGASAAPAASS